MAKNKRLIALLIAAIMIISLAACGGSDTPPPLSTPSGNNAAATPGEDIVRVMFSVAGGKDEAEMELFVQAIYDATGITVIAEKPASDYDNIMMQKLQAGEVFELIQVNAPHYLNLAEQGALLDITDRIEASEILTNNVDPREWDDIRVNGRIYAGFSKVELHRVVSLNRNHLENAGIDYTQIEPTLDGYLAVFRALRAANSDPDYFPFNAVLSLSYDLQPWMAAAGLKAGTVIDADGQRYSPYSTDESIPIWEWLRTLYQEGLLDPGSFVDETRDLREKMGAASQRTSVVVDWAMWVGLHNGNATAGGIAEEDFEVVPLPGVRTPDGGHMLVKGAANLFMVPRNAENVDGAIRLLEFFATQEGGDLLQIGIYGHDYNIVDGQAVLTEIGIAHNMDHGAPIPIYRNWVPMLPLNRGVDAGLALLPYASIQRIIPNNRDWEEVTGRWGIQIIRGELDAAAALEGMRNELILLDVVDR